MWLAKQIPKSNKHDPFNKHLQSFLYGKQLLESELPFTQEELQFHYEHGYLSKHQGLSQFTCHRCGNKRKHLFATFPCAKCGTNCRYCRSCIRMGRVSSCTALYSWSGPKLIFENIDSTLAWNGTLSKGQQAASDLVIEAIHNQTDLLVWAVCGAGKTEVLFAGIEKALQAGKYVCIATPRTDVVLELAPRFQKVFPNVPVRALYGGSLEKNEPTALIISTTHQLFRFHQAFDVMIIDEVDAFPFSFDSSLQFAVEKAKKPASTMIYLTATPNQTWQRECRSGKRKFITIPARYHRYPLPVPTFVWCGNWKKPVAKGRLPKNVQTWITNRIQQNKQALLFIPRIDMIDTILPIMQKIHPSIESVHAEDPDRKEKVQRMREKKIPLLLTTTILERGVTFPNLDVAILGAEDAIFTESALVQIAGRVGRSAQYPSGNITFFHYGKTNAMVKARHQIRKMNQEARREGLIDL